MVNAVLVDRFPAQAHRHLDRRSAMGGKTLAVLVGRWAILGTPLLWPMVGSAAPAAGFSSAVRENQLILYVSKPFGSSAPRTWGLRLDQASAPPVTTSSIPLGPLHKRELVNLMITPHVRAQIEFGGRLTWDLRGRRLSLERH
jgi:hypothetical protein